jgi:hypothetical protein
LPLLQNLKHEETPWLPCRAVLYGKLLLAMGAGKGVRLGDLVYLSSWIPSLNIQLMEEEALVAKREPSPPVETVSRENRYLLRSPVPLGTVYKVMEQVGLYGHGQEPQAHIAGDPTAHGTSHFFLKD